MLRRTLSCAAVAVFLCISLEARTPERTYDGGQVSVGVTVKPLPVTIGMPAILSLTLKLEAGAHANANVVTDPNLIPTAFLPTDQPGLKWGKPEYPKATEVTEWYATDPLSVFADGSVISVPFVFDKDVATREVTIGATLRIQVCDSEKCYPVKRVPVSATVNVVNAANANSEEAEKGSNQASIPSRDKPAMNQPASDKIDFEFVDFTGKRRSLAEFRGKYVLLDFWATWCKPCLADIPKLKELYAKYRGRGFEIIGMDSETIGDEAEDPDPEFAKETAERARTIVSTRGVMWPQATNETAVPVAMKLFGVKALPTKILIDRQGREIARIGEKDDLNAIVEKLLVKEN